MSNESNWQYTGTESSAYDSSQQTDDASISWTASEYIAHEKTQVWLMVVVGSSLFVCAIMYLLYEDILTSLAVLTAGVCLGVLGMRQPNAQKYELSGGGLSVGAKTHRFADFKSFSIVEEGAIDSIWLKPLARFKPPVVIYFAPDDEERILDVLSRYLPHEQRELDPIDRLSRKIRF